MRVCLCSLYLAGLGGPASAARFGAPHRSCGRSLCLLYFLGPLQAGFALLLCGFRAPLFLFFAVPPSSVPCVCLLPLRYRFSFWCVWFSSFPVFLSPLCSSCWGVSFRPVCLPVSFFFFFFCFALPCFASFFGFFCPTPPPLFLPILLCLSLYPPLRPRAFFFSPRFLDGGAFLRFHSPLLLAAPGAVCCTVLLLCRACAFIGTLVCVARGPLGVVLLRCTRCALAVRCCLWCSLAGPPPCPGCCSWCCVVSFVLWCCCAVCASFCACFLFDSVLLLCLCVVLCLLAVRRGVVRCPFVVRRVLVVPPPRCRSWCPVVCCVVLCRGLPFVSVCVLLCCVVLVCVLFGVPSTAPPCYLHLLLPLFWGLLCCGRPLPCPGCAVLFGASVLQWCPCTIPCCCSRLCALPCVLLCCSAVCGVVCVVMCVLLCCAVLFLLCLFVRVTVSLCWRFGCLLVCAVVCCTVPVCSVRCPVCRVLWLGAVPVAVCWVWR